MLPDVEYTVRPSRTQTIYHQVADELREAIQQGRYAAGSPMPSERSLAKKLGVGRDSIRDALRVLAREGLVELGGSNGVTLVRPRTTRRAVVIPADAIVIARMPLLGECPIAGIPAGAVVPLFVVRVPGQRDKMYAADRVELRFSSRTAARDESESDAC